EIQRGRTGDNLTPNFSLAFFLVGTLGGRLVETLLQTFFTHLAEIHGSFGPSFFLTPRRNPREEGRDNCFKLSHFFLGGKFEGRNATGNFTPDVLSYFLGGPQLHSRFPSHFFLGGKSGGGTPVTSSLQIS